jgi:hypothetical protein
MSILSTCRREKTLGIVACENVVDIQTAAADYSVGMNDARRNKDAGGACHDLTLSGQIYLDLETCQIVLVADYEIEAIHSMPVPVYVSRARVNIPVDTAHDAVLAAIWDEALVNHHVTEPGTGPVMRQFRRGDDLRLGKEPCHCLGQGRPLERIDPADFLRRQPGISAWITRGCRDMEPRRVHKGRFTRHGLLPADWRARKGCYGLAHLL